MSSTKTPVFTRLARVVTRSLRHHGLTHRQSPLLVALSGGPDSVALLHILAHLRERLGLRLHAAHLDHGLPGDGEETRRFVEALTASLDISIAIDQADVPAYAKRGHLSLEDAARRLRYAFLARMASSLGGDTVALGHTASDQAETVLFHLVRGSGLRGLRGMAPLTLWQSPAQSLRLWLFRPLLSAKREETRALCQEMGIRPLEDPSNLLTRFTRNRLRLEALPLLRQINPSVDEALIRLARSAAHDEEFIQREVERLWRRAARRGEASVELPRAPLEKLHPALLHRLLQRAYAYCREGSGQLEYRHIEAMARLVGEGASKQVSLPNGLLFVARPQGYLLAREAGQDSPWPALEGEWPLKVPGSALAGPWEMHASLGPPPNVFPEATALTACLDATAVGNTLMIRSRRPGDRFQPLGMEVEKKLQDFLVGAGVPRQWRDGIPLVAAQRGIAWVVGYRIAHWARLTPQTRHAVTLELRLLRL